MSENWAKRQRHTNKCARKIASYLFEQSEITPVQLYGLSRLAWITKSYDGKNASYIESTKIPALGNIFNEDYSSFSLNEVAKDASLKMNDPDFAKLINKHTGFTNFYSAYRNSSLEWVKTNFSTLLPLYQDAFSAKNKNDRLELIKGIQETPGIPKKNQPAVVMKAQYFLTPVFFMLDEKNKFPIINGSKGVENLLKALNHQSSDLKTQFTSMVELIGSGGISDAPDLDQIRGDLSEFISTKNKKAKKGLLKSKKTKGKTKLPLKDENDVEVIRTAGTAKQRKIHNQLTNKIRSSLSNYTLIEGSDKTCMFDVLVENYHKKNDLMIEVKSSLERPNIRMAVGQLYDYWYSLNGSKDPHIAILLPNKPDNNCISFLERL